MPRVTTRRTIPSSDPAIRDSVQSLKDYCAENDRICPMPRSWDHLWKLLPNRRRVGNGWEPPAPLILAAWHESSGLDKMVRLAMHIEWADRCGALDSISVYLRALREDEWCHLSDRR